MRFEFTRGQALKLGLLICKCGHRPNNHFEWSPKPCAHCECKGYDEKAVMGGKLVLEMPPVRKLTDDMIDTPAEVERLENVLRWLADNYDDVDNLHDNISRALRGKSVP